ncbi:hypothetical protein [Alistipes sp. An66]|uniref:hypothetical protein n=1 Tax=Alistipes sp. An66 TaxID=1965650 RepID=UPI000B586AC0|nr:hypothetical protein [Alistipes sp. An66]OUN58587.1 hypothetical protein B5G16_08180 [Alistipes sp. An66]
MKVWILFLTTAFALTFAATSCSKDDDSGGLMPEEENQEPVLGEMSISDLSAPIRCVFTSLEDAENGCDPIWNLYFYDQMYVSRPDYSDIESHIQIPESFFGKTIDLTQPLDQEANPQQQMSIFIRFKRDLQQLILLYHDNRISVLNSIDGLSTVVRGTLRIDRNGNWFVIEMTTDLSDGQTAAIHWCGPVI